MGCKCWPICLCLNPFYNMQGRFRWAVCQLDTLARCPNPRTISHALDHLPQNLEVTYRRMLHSIPKDLRNGAIRLLQFLVHTRQPLTVPQAIDIVATEEEPPNFDVGRRAFSEEEVLRYCPSLISIIPNARSRNDRSRNELHLAHFSVKEYLLGEDQFKISTASISITRTCLTYLTGVNISGRGTTRRNNVIQIDTRWYEDIELRFPMAIYAAKVWTRYAAFSQGSEDIVRAIVRFLEDEIPFQRWIYFHRPEGTRAALDPPSGSRLYYTCLVGLVGPARHFISRGANVNARGGIYGYALQAASQGGFQEIVTLLLAKGADVNAQGGRYGNALRAATEGGHREIAKLLLAKGADINEPGDKNGTALQIALDRGDRELVILFLANGADVNAFCDPYGKHLQVAAQKGHRETVLLLLDDVLNANMQASYYDIAVRAYRSCYKAQETASRSGHQEIVELLQRYRIEIINAIRSSTPRTPSNKILIKLKIWSSKSSHSIHLLPGFRPCHLPLSKVYV